MSKDRHKNVTKEERETKENINALKKILREKRLEADEEIGHFRSKTFGGKLENRHLRRDTKNNLRRMVDTQEFDFTD